MNDEGRRRRQRFVLDCRDGCRCFGRRSRGSSSRRLARLMQDGTAEQQEGQVQEQEQQEGNQKKRTEGGLNVFYYGPHHTSLRKQRGQSRRWHP